MAIDPKIVDRIRKLLSLGGNNDQANEAEAALKKAAILAEKHGLALSDINPETGEVSTVEKNSVPGLHQRHACWSKPLAAVIARCFDCQSIISKSRGWDRKWVETIVFLGTPTDLEMTIWYYKLIRLKTIRGADAKYTYVKDQKMYGMGILDTMRVRLKEMFVKEQAKVRSSETTALVLVKKDAVNAEVKRQFPHIRSVSTPAPVNGDLKAYAEGRKDGGNMTLHRGSIETGNKRKIA